MFPEIFRDEIFRLETQRLWLRWPVDQDAAPFATLAGEKDVARWTAYIPHPYPADEALKFIRAARRANSEGRHLYFALTLKSRPRAPIGMISLETKEQEAELGYWLGQPYWSHGFMSEALTLLMEILWRATSIQRLSAYVMTENGRSQKLLERNGFAIAGETVCPAPARGGDAPALRLTRMRSDQARASYAA